ncbi:hypothetical protein ElyMa_006092000 [Elysia marginata]|uniref:t-SNARE coiled-coil homology domain-containing protein n=1 Tax=Elysia marginata TaxID=1093978 RepID=A0AAV4GU70_9GAST|nr:hypothetical protein ElyMa_006092000 [Elysia marginata]
MASSNNNEILSLHEECDAALFEGGGEKLKEQTDILSALQEQTVVFAKVLEAKGRSRKRQRGSNRAGLSSLSSSPSPSHNKVKRRTFLPCKSISFKVTRPHLSPRT